MIKVKYSEDFERVWNAFDSAYGSKGSKKNAYSAFKILKCDSDDSHMIECMVYKQIKEKKASQLQTGFFESFPHVERFLRNRRFEDEEAKPNHTQNTSLRQSTSIDRIRAEMQQRDEREIQSQFFEVPRRDVD